MYVIAGIPLQVLCVWLACHFIGDFSFQSAWMNMEKGKSWEVNFYHGATYTAVFVLFAHSSLLGTAVFLRTHLVLDPLKAPFKIIGPILLEMILHNVTYG